MNDFDDVAPWDDTNGEFGDDPFGDDTLPDIIPIDEVFGRSDRRRPPSRQEKLEAMAKKALEDKGAIKFEKLGTDKNGDIWQVIRRKGESKPGIIRHDGKSWRFFPLLNFNFDVKELDEICAFMGELL